MQEKVRHIIGRVFHVPLDQITEETKVETVESWDSLNHINLVLALEQEFRITFAPEEIMTMVSFSEVLEVLKQKMQMGDVA